VDPNEPTNQPNPFDSVEPTNQPPAMDVTPPPSEPIMPTPIEQPSAPIITGPEMPGMASLPEVPSESLPPTPQSNKKLLIIIISIVVVLLATIGIVLAVVLLSNKEETTPPNNNPPMTNPEPEPEPEPEPPVVVGEEKLLACKSMIDVSPTNPVAFNMIMQAYFNDQDVASKFVIDYEYQFVGGQKVTEEVLTAGINAIKTQFAALNFDFAGEIISDNAMRITMTDKTGDKISLDKLYGGNDYDTVKKAFEQECASLDGEFSAP